MLSYLTFISVALLQIVSSGKQPKLGEQLEPKYEMFTVVVSFFSGRNNPEWVVKNNRALTELMVNARKKENFGLPAQMPGRLGYRGILVEDNITKIPGLLVGPKSTKLQLELLRNIPEKMKFKSGDLEEIINTIRGGKIDFEKAPTFQVRGKRYAPPYHPAWWNALEPAYRRQRCNNCYDYATMFPTDKRAQPGIDGGQKYTVGAFGVAIAHPHTAANLIAAAQRDGLTELQPHPEPADPVPGAPNDLWDHLVALVVRPDNLWRGGDFHWYRLDSNGQWSHKPGESQVRQTDNAGNPILDPRAANNGAYQFAGFMVSNMFTTFIEGDFWCPV